MAFSKGSSGNPSGRPRKVAPESMTLDGWMSMITGIGTAQYDKRTTAQVVVEPVGDLEAQAIYRSDDMGARCIDIRPKEMFREGFSVCIADLAPDPQSEATAAETPAITGIGPGMLLGRAGAPTGFTRDQRRVGARRYDRASALRLDAQAARAQDIAERAYKKFEALDIGARTISKYQTVLSYAAAYGGGGLLIGARDGSDDWSQPLREERVRSVDFLTTLEPREMTPLSYYTDPLSPKYDEVEVWQIAPTSTGTGTALTAPVYVHESRIIYFPGIQVSRAQPSVLIGHGDSVFTRVRGVLRDFNLGWSSASIILNEFSIATMSIENLSEMVSTDDRKKLLARMAAVRLGQSVAKLTLIDTKEKIERQTASVAGLADLLEKFMVRVAAAFDVPVTILMGVSPTGLNATGASDIRSWYDDIASEQKKVLGPRLRRLIGLIIRSMNGGREPAKWSIDFAPLWQESAKEKADTRFVDAQTDEKNILNGIYTADEVRRSRYGGDKYGTEIMIDEPAGYEPTDADVADYKASTTPPPGGVPPRGGGGLEPAKVTSLMAVITAVAAGTLPRDNALGVLQVAFGFDAPTAELLLPAEGSAPAPDPEDTTEPPEDGEPDLEDLDEPDEPTTDSLDSTDDDELTLDYSEDQPRAENGQFGEGGGSTSNKSSPTAIAKAGARVQKAAAKVATVKAKLAAAKVDRTAANKAAKAAISVLNKANKAAKSAPSAKALAAVKVATRAAAKASVKAEKAAQKVEKHSDAHRAAKEAHTAARGALKAAAQKAPSPTSAIAVKAAKIAAEKAAAKAIAAAPAPIAAPIAAPAPVAAAPKTIQEAIAAPPIAARPLTDTELAAAGERVLSSLTHAERAALEDYQGNSYYPLNEALRSSGSFEPFSQMTALRKNLDSLMEKNRSTQAMVSYRGTGPIPAFEKLKPGEVVVDKGFVSTSADKERAFTAQILMHITSPAGTKLAAVQTGGTMDGEKEVLLARGTALRLDRREDTVDAFGRGITNLHMTVVGQQ